MKEDTASRKEIKPVQRNGVTVRIRHTEKNGFERFVVDYRNQGQRKLVWRSSLADARAAANDAIDKITEGQGEVLNLKSADAHAFNRARTILDGGEGETKIDLRIDEAVRVAADAIRMLAGRADPLEVCRDWLKRNATELPKTTIAAAVEQLKAQLSADRKSHARQQQIAGVMDRFSADLKTEVHCITSDIISRWLSGLPLAERSRRNFRDVIGYFCRFCVRRGYLSKGTDWLEGVQNYTARKQGAILIYTPEEMKALLNAADKRIVPFLAIGAFAGLRHAEIARLDWSEIDLEDGFIEVRSIENTKSDQRRRLVPIKANLKAWLLPHKQKAGSVCPLKGTKDQLHLVAEAAKMDWRKNALRHSCISYRVAETGDVPRISDESGNSVQVIRTNYLRRVKPQVAAEWFAIQPSA